MIKKIIQNLRRVLPGSASSTPPLKRKLCRASTSGFTLIETMVTVLIFSVVMSLALGVFLSTVRNQRAAMYRQRLITETSYVMSRIEESIRKGEENYNISDFYSEEPMTINDSYYEEGNKITVLLKSEIEVSDERTEHYRLQTTVLKD